MKSDSAGRKARPDAAWERMAAYLSRYGADGQMDPHRALEIRLRIASGFYDRRGVHLAAAERMLRSGDVEMPE